jgi:hypothetical protein
VVALRVKDTVRELFRYLRLHIQRLGPLAENYETRPRAPGRSPVWLSLTTLPSRISRVGPTLKSLLDQTVRVDGIRLNLPQRSRRENCPYTIPPHLDGVPPIQLASCDKDWGPITKLLPTVQDFEDRPDAKIIIVDDDTIYPRTMVEALTTCSETLPDSAICMRGWKLPKDYRHCDRRYIQASGVHSATPVAIMQGASGFLVKPRFFEGGVLHDEQAPDEAFFVDDILVSGTLARVGVARHVAPSPIRFVRISSLAAMGTPSLVHGENKDGHNNATLYRYFDPYWRLRDES